MANPDILDNGSVTQDILVDAQLASGDNDYIVPPGRAWTIRSVTLCNTSGNTVTLNLSVIRSGGTARKIVHNETIAGGDTLALDTLVLAMLPEGATLRVNSTAATAVDVLITGVVAA